MDINLIKKLVRIIEDSTVTDLEVEENGFKVRIAKKVRTAAPQGIPSQMISQIQPAPDHSIADVRQDKIPKDEVVEDLHTIRSPIVGTFYRAPAPDADSYVNVGDTISVGSVLCIVEAMKLMNEIESDVSGKIIKILVENGKPVEYNQPLFLIKT